MSRPISAAALLLCGAALAQDRPDEATLFGASTADAGPASLALPERNETDGGVLASPVTGTPHETPTLPEGTRDARELSAPDTSRNAFATGESVENPLQIGGLFYLRGFASAHENTSFNHTTESLPLQVNGFLDARPNDRIRAYVLGRLQYDPTLDGCSAQTNSPVISASAPCPRYPGGSPNASGSGGNGQTSSTSSAPSSFGGGSPLPNNPAVLLDQAWLKFDFARTVFVTAGKQHVKWGASRFWNPTDFLHTQRRDPLLPYDLRLGNTMAKFEVPIEAWTTNFYAVALFDNPQGASTLGQLGGAFRAEKVIGTAEVGAEVVLRNSLHPVIGADFSAPVGPFDVYAEASYRQHSDLPPLSFPAGFEALGTLLGSDSPYAMPTGHFVQVSGGFTYQFGYVENRLATLGVEYFYNALGLSSADAYPAVIFGGGFQPFYIGKHYAALYATIEGPDQFKHTNYTLSNLGNLSDDSFITRLDFSWRLLTYLTFEAYGDVHYGNRGGEFRFAFNGPQLAQQLGPLLAPNALQLLQSTLAPVPTFDVGIGLRVSL